MYSQFTKYSLQKLTEGTWRQTIPFAAFSESKYYLLPTIFRQSIIARVSGSQGRQANLETKTNVQAYAPLGELQ